MQKEPRGPSVTARLFVCVRAPTGTPGDSPGPSRTVARARWDCGPPVLSAARAPHAAEKSVLSVALAPHAVNVARDKQVARYPDTVEPAFWRRGRFGVAAVAA